MDIDYRVARLEEGVAQQQGLVQVAARVVTKVEDELAHPLLLQGLGSLAEFLEGGAGELREADVGRAVADHERGIHAVLRDLAAGDFERDDLLATLDRDRDFRAGHAPHPADHAVLRVLAARDHDRIHLEQAVSRLQADLFRRASRDDLDHHGRVVGHVELNAYAVEAAGEIGLGLFELLRGEIDGMRVELGKGGNHGSVSDFLPVHDVHIILVHLLEDEIQLAPVLILGAKAPLALDGLLHVQGEKGSDRNARERYRKTGEITYFHFCHRAARTRYSRSSEDLFRP